MKRPLSRGIVAAALAVALWACGSDVPGPETPEDRAAIFVNAIINQTPAIVWESLDRPSQEAIAARAGLSVDAPDVAAKAFALSGRWRNLVSLKPIKPHIDLNPDGQKLVTVTLQIEALSGEKMPLELRKDGEHWRVHLPIEEIGAAPASAPAASTSSPTSASAPTSAPSSASASAPASAPLVAPVSAPAPAKP